MRIIRYIIHGVLTRFGIALLLLSLIYIAIDFVEAQNRGAAPESAYLFRLPMVLSHMLPIALVLGVQALIAGLRTRGEWNAFLAVGIGPERLGLYLLLIPLIAMPFQYLMQSLIVPQSHAAWQNAAGGERLRPDLGGDLGARNWCLQENLLIKREGTTGSRIVISRTESGVPLLFQSERVGQRQDAVREWQYGHGWVFGRSSAPDATEDRLCAAGGFQGKWATDSDPHPQELTTEALRTFLLVARHGGHPTRHLEAEIALRMALTLSCLLVPFLALGMTVGGQESRHGRIVGLGLLSVFAYWLMVTVAWNGALAGLWCSEWLSLGVPSLTLILGGLLAALRRRELFGREIHFRFTT